MYQVSCSVLPCVAVCCSVLQMDLVLLSVYHVSCNVLQCVAGRPETDTLYVAGVL